MGNPGAVLEVGISAREAEVLLAVGDHLTNAEIATRLFISIRTVESHVSSLLRKLQAVDRRELIARAGSVQAADAGPAHIPVASTISLPAPLTPFVGRVAEREALVAALQEDRLVTAVGPGGVGKTRLALQVAAELADRFADGVWYVDLVPTTDDSMVDAAIAEVLGIGERQGSSAAEDVVTWFAGRSALLVLDNCEHLLDGVVVLLERLLGSSARLVVLATSRARLLAPFERVFLVPGLSIEAPGGGVGDAVELFRARARTGGAVVREGDVPRVAVICSALDGTALAIELAAARCASLGLDGLEAGLPDVLRLLTGASRVNDRHRSLRRTLDWSYELLDEPDQAVLRRVSSFADSFSASQAAAVTADWPPVLPAHVTTALAGLVDQSLLVAIARPNGTAYRPLETVRQYALARLDEAGELFTARSRHLRWCREQGSVLVSTSRRVDRAWRAEVDQVADELRAALTWAADEPSLRAEAYGLAMDLAHIVFIRGFPGEAQRRYEQAAELTVDGAAAALAWRSAAGAAEARYFGEDALRLRAHAVEAALRAGDRAGAATDLARNAELINRGPGLMATVPGPDVVEALIERGWTLADGDVHAEARLLTAEAFNGATTDPATVRLVGRALALARRMGDPLIESAALDQLTAVQFARGDVRAGAASALRRITLLSPLPVTALSALEFFDAFVMAINGAIAVGDLSGARGLAEQMRELPFYREETHLNSARLIVVTVLTGDLSEAVDLARLFREGWEGAGRPRAGDLSRGAYAAATAYGLQGEETIRADWLEVVLALQTPGRSIAQMHFGEFFDALMLLHAGQPSRVVELMVTPPEEFTEWFNGMWRPWYAALWAEAAVLSGSEGVGAVIARARVQTEGNPIATAIVDRAAALGLLDGCRTALLQAASVFEKAGCHYQLARTLIFLGDEHRTRGEAMVAAMGATPMVWPPEQHSSESAPRGETD
ncbi:MAG: LuxR C-terminal-related transcriptional regulator [Terracoccus sp.]